MADGGTEGTPRKAAAMCPICKTISHERYRPFCSKRCADIDLGRWLAGTYAIAGNDGEADEPAPEPSANDRMEAGPED